MSLDDRFMPRRPRAYGPLHTLSVVLIFLALAALAWLVVLALQSDARSDCEARGGVWLYRESACVQGPTGGSGR